MSFYLDLTEFLTHPITTGIQRVEGEMCRYLRPGAAIPVRFRPGGFVALSPSLIEVIGGYFRQGSEGGMEAISRLGAFANGAPVELSGNDTVLVPEVFNEPERVGFFSGMTEEEFSRCRFIVFDLLPITHPEFFGQRAAIDFYGYSRILRRSASCGFISAYTRDVYQQRLKRAESDGGMVLRLGCDSLGPRPQKLSLNRPLRFAVLGTIEPRKNHSVILEAFEPLLQQVEGLELSFIGKMGWVDEDFAGKVLRLAEDQRSGFHFYPTPDDHMIRSNLQDSRATIYLSSAEGYGLPPVESLWLGTPVIASNTVPSLETLGTSGVHIVEPLTVTNIRRAVLAFLDDGYANKKSEEAMQLNLPTWQSFADEVLAWCRQPSASLT